MRNRNFVLKVIIVCIVFVSPAFCRGGKYTTPVSAPARRSATTPASLGQSGSVRRAPERTYASTNRIINVNVARDRYFRGMVPYGSVSEFQTDIESDDLYSFVRRSAGISYRGSASKYDLPSHGTFAGGVGKYTFDDLSGRNPTSTYYQKRPSLPGIKELERRILRQPELFKIQEAEKSTEIAGEVVRQKKITEWNDTLTDAPQKPVEPADIEDTYERLRKARQKRKDELLRRELIDEIAPVEVEQQNDESEMSSERYDNHQKSSDQPETTEADEPDGYDKTTDLHARALELRDEHATFAEFAEAKFKKYILAAGEFTKEGKYYMAADAYSLAEVYGPENIEAITGMAHSLFAAGEYMSSAFLLRKALRLQPEYARETTHLGELLIDRDMIENRIIELEKCVNYGKVPELSFLMAYILYRTDRPDTAMNFIGTAVEEMRDSPAVLTLKVEIEKARRF
jgi:tetratricopeptide (TPR) repeat protein